tara:strand:- start:18752 stop:19312 length:561 start_codon:yes stop_codon:yes gene_type:complete
MKKMMIALAGAALLSGTALASAQEGLFHGPYAGVEVGYNDFNVDVDGVDVGADGFSYGGFFGYRSQMSNNLVLGLEARVGESTASIEEAGAKIDAGRQLGIDATIGTTLGSENNMLAFAFVGYENARLTLKEAGMEESEDLDGIRFGVGGEYALAQNLNLRATFAYTDYESDLRNIQFLTGLVYNF